MNWRYVPTDCNPADILSRCASPSELLQSVLLFRGPEFLLKNQHDLPKSCLPVKTLPDIRKRILVGVANEVDMSLKCKFVNFWQ